MYYVSGPRVTVFSYPERTVRSRHDSYAIPFRIRTERLGTLRRNIKRATGAVALGAALALAMAACGGDDSDGGGGGGGGGASTVTLGFMGDLTGENAGIVIPPRNGAKMAIDEYNATNPKTKITLKEYDSQGKPEQASSLVQQAVKNDKIAGLVGPAFSGESKVADAVLEEAKIPNISPSATATSLAANNWKYFHRVLANDDAQGPAAADLITRDIKAKKAFVIDDSQEYSVGLADAVDKTLKGKGVQVSRDKIDMKANDYSSTVTKVKSAAPDAIFYGGYYAQAGRLLKQIREGGVKAPFMSGDGSFDAGLIKGAGSANAQKAVTTCPCNVPDPGGQSANPKATKFATDYKTKFNADVKIYSSEGYDAATAFIEAIKAGNTSTESINNFLKTVSFEGVSKPIKFEANGELATKIVYAYQVEGDKLVNLGTTDKAALK